MIDSVSPTTAPQINDPDGSKAKKAGGELGKDAFLKLLVAQLRYQDPMKPAGGTEFVAQTAQFSMVESLTEMAKANAEVLSSQRSQTAVGMIGKTVIYTDPTTKKDVTGVVTGVLWGGDAGPVLKMGDKEVPPSSVKEVTTTPTTPPAPPAA